MPHVHGVSWLNFTKAEEELYLQHDKTFDLDSSELPTLIDQWSQCKLNTGNEKLDKIVKEVNIHTHTDSCRKKGTYCRFDFPKLPSPRTLIAKPLSPDLPDDERQQKLKKAKGIKEKVLAVLDKAIENCWDLETLLKAADPKLDEKMYIKDCLLVSERGATVILERQPCEAFVNNYNVNYMYAWQANMDIQVCTDPYAVVSYISDYISKPDAGLTRMMRTALAETKGLLNDERIDYLKKAYLTHREICTSEAVYRISRGLHLRESNLKTVFIDSGFPQERSNLLRRVREDENEDSEEDIDDNLKAASDNIIEIVDRPGKFRKGISVHERYSMRPTYLDDMCLAQFGTTYEPNYYSQNKIVWEGNVSEVKTDQNIFGTEKHLPKFIKLDNSRCMKARTIPAVLKLYNSKKRSPHAAAFAEMVLFSPWRNETELCPLNEFDCFSEFEKRYGIIQSNRCTMLPFSSTLEQIKESIAILEEEKANDYYAEIDPSFQQEQDDDLEYLEAPDMSELPQEPDEKNTKADGSFRPIKSVSEEQMIYDIRSLSIDQKIVFERLLSYCKSLMFSHSKFSSDIEPPRIIITGKWETYFLFSNMHDFN